MITSATIFILVSFLILSVIFHGRFKGAALGILELHFAAASLSFSVYTLIDIFFKPIINLDIIAIVSAFGVVIISMYLIGLIGYIFQIRLAKFSSISAMSRRWIDANLVTILMITAIIIIFNLYLYSVYGIIGSFSELEIELLGLTMPAWVSSTRTLLEGFGFGVFIFAFSHLTYRTNISRSVTFLLLLLMIAMFALGGRRSLLNLALVAAAIWSMKHGRQFYSFRNLTVLLISGFFMLIFSNIYQTYRNDVLSVSGGGSDGSLPGLYEAATNFKATADNLGERTAMWEFNYLIASKQVTMEKSPMYGALFLQSLENSVPRFLWPSKNVIDPDGMVAIHYGLPVVDYPTNNFATLQADFGLVMILFLPLVIFIPIYILMFIDVKSPDMYLFSSGLVVRYLLNIENSPGDIFILLRDIGLCWFFLVISRISIKIGSQLLRSSKSFAKQTNR